MNFERMITRTKLKAKEKEKKKKKEDMKANLRNTKKREEARRLARELAECYAEVAETDISEESDSAIKEIIYGMFRRGEYIGALNLLMIIFELADRKEASEIIRCMSSEMLKSAGRA